MANDIKVGIKITADGDQAKAELAGVANAAGDVGQQTATAKPSIDGFAAAFEPLGKAALWANELRELGGVILAQLGDVAATADAYNNMAGRLKLVAGEGSALADALEAVRRTANASGADIDATATLYTRLSQATKALGLSQDEVVALTDTINKTFAVSGASAAEAASSIRQLSQAMASGLLRGDEFNSVMENSPRLAQAMSDGLGVPIGKLREMAEQGKLTAEVVTRALQSQADAIAADFAKMPDTIGRATQRLANEWTVFIGELDKTSGASATVAEALNGLAGNLDEIANVATKVGEVAVTAFALRAAGAVRAYVVEIVAAEGASVALATASSGLAAGLARIAPLLKSLGYAAIAVEVFEITKNLMALREEYNRQAEIGARTADIQARVASKLGEVSAHTGIAFKSMKEFNAAVADNRVHFDASTGAWKAGAKPLEDAGTKATTLAGALKEVAEAADAAKKSQDELQKKLAVFGLEDVHRKFIDGFRAIADDPNANGSQILSALLVALESIPKERVPELMAALRRAADAGKLSADELATGFEAAESRMAGLWGEEIGRTQDLTAETDKLKAAREEEARARARQKEIHDRLIATLQAESEALQHTGHYMDDLSGGIGSMADSINGAIATMRRLGENSASVINTARRAVFEATNGNAEAMKTLQKAVDSTTSSFQLYYFGIWEAQKRAIAGYQAEKEALDALVRGVQDGTVNADDLRYNFQMLGEEDLIPLRSAIADAQARMRALEDSAASTLNGIRDELDQLQGDYDEIERRRAQIREDKIRAQIAEAEATGNKAAVADLVRALEILKEVSRLRIEEARQREREERSRAGTTSNTDTGDRTGGVANFAPTINLNGGLLGTPEEVARLLLPEIERIYRLRS